MVYFYTNSTKGNKLMKVCIANDSFPPLIDGVIGAVINYASYINRDYGSAVVTTPYYPNAIDEYPFDVIRYKSFDTEKKLGYRTGYPFSTKAMKQLAGAKVAIGWSKTIYENHTNDWIDKFFYYMSTVKEGTNQLYTAYEAYENANDDITEGNANFAVFYGDRNFRLPN